MQTETLIWLIPLPPLVAFTLIVLVTNKNRALSHTLGVGAAFLSWLGAIVVFARAIGEGFHHLGEAPFASAFNWLPLGDSFLQIGVRIDPLSAVTLFFVGWTVLMITLYSIGYQNFGAPKGDHDRPGLPPHGATVTDDHGHKHTVPSVEPNYSRFFAFLGLFAFGMYVLVVSDNLLTLFVGWEIMGLCSYLLIGFWYARESARAAAIKAFMTTRVGDVFMLLGLVYLYSEAGSLSYHVIFSPEVLERLAHDPAVGGLLGLTAAGLIGILLFIGTVGKSAQFPLHVWLPDAMEGPTPVSAMIHAATMVSAGVYMVIRIFPILSAGSDHGQMTAAMTVLAVIGAFTALFSATIALAQNDIKRVLAYSTISQLGFMIAALGIGAYVAAAFHLMTHAFFKALLFLGSGSVIHGMEHGVLHTGDHDVDPQDMRNMGGLRTRMPVTFWTFLIGGFALAGFPLVTAGFWSKDEILADAWAHQHYTVFITLAVAALLTAFYTMRQITMTFLGEPRTEAARHAHETPWTMTLPLAVLAVFAIVAGWIGIPNDFLGLDLGEINFFHGVAYTLLPSGIEPPGITFHIIPLLTSIGVAGLGLYLGWLVYRGYTAGASDPLQKALGPVYKVLQNKYYFDELYDFLFVRPAKWISETFVYLWLDRGLIDGILHTLARIAYWLGGIFRNRLEMPIISEGADRLGDGVRDFGWLLRKSQTGNVQGYLNIGLVLVVVIGVVVVLLLN
ncbi:MAG TPA: NADH-quinone oxidoreductase subunit L [Anaerolineales bacterium]|nr:NADH-quinone oxidoreductase subunit L [Anaerolineales bacterium]